MPEREVVCLNGRFVPAAEASVRVDDRGFMLADGVYEVVRVYEGRPFLLDRHMQRLERSAAALELALDPPSAELRAICEELVRRQCPGEGTIYLQVTRGAATRTHAFPADAKPTTLVMTGGAPANTADARRSGVTAITVPDDRWARCDIKTIALTANVLAKQKAVKAGAFEAIFVRDGFVTDAASSNVFAVFGQTLMTPPKTNYILAGITRDLVLELARANGVPVAEEPLRVERLRQAGEVWITSTTAEVMPVVRLDGAPVGGGEPGPLAWRLQGLFEEFRKRG